MSVLIIKKFTEQYFKYFIYLITFFVAYYFWGLFRPVLMSNDSLDQYRMALSLQLTDQHSPLLILILRFFINLGLGLDGFMFFQILMGLFGILFLGSEIIRYLMPKVENKYLPEFFLLIFILIFSLDFSPLPFYLMTFWKDSFLACLLLWIGFFYVRCLSDEKIYPWLIMNIFMAVSLLIRDNSIFLVPVFGVMSFQQCPARMRRSSSRYGLFLAPILLSTFFNIFMTKIFHIQSVINDRVLIF